MSYYKIIANMRSNYVQWLARDGKELPARLANVAAAGALTFERACAEHAVVGDVAEVVARIQQLAEETGAGQILAWMNIGSADHGLVVDSMRRFADEVMPRL